MRLAANRHSPFFNPLALEAKVYLNGVQRSNVLEADEEAGWIDVVTSGPEGGLVLKNDGVCVHRECGRVVLLFAGERL